MATLRSTTFHVSQPPLFSLSSSLTVSFSLSLPLTLSHDSHSPSLTILTHPLSLLSLARGPISPTLSFHAARNPSFCIVVHPIPLPHGLSLVLFGLKVRSRFSFRVNRLDLTMIGIRRWIRSACLPYVKFTSTNSLLNKGRWNDSTFCFCSYSFLNQGERWVGPSEAGIVVPYPHSLNVCSSRLKGVSKSMDVRICSLGSIVLKVKLLVPFLFLHPSKQGMTWKQK